MSDFHVTSNLFLNFGFSFWLPRITITIKNKQCCYNSYFLFEIPPETNSQFTFYSYCLSRFKVSNPTRFGFAIQGEL